MTVAATSSPAYRTLSQPRGDNCFQVVNSGKKNLPLQLALLITGFQESVEPRDPRPPLCFLTLGASRALDADVVNNVKTTTGQQGKSLFPHTKFLMLWLCKWTSFLTHVVSISDQIKTEETQ